jgi:hypothetical protein
LAVKVGTVGESREERSLTPTLEPESFSSDDNVGRTLVMLASMEPGEVSL